MHNVLFLAIPKVNWWANVILVFSPLQESERECSPLSVRCNGC